MSMVTEGALMMCDFGVAPATLSPLPHMVMAASMPVATITDSAPMVNIPTFGMCSSLANPEVASATSAALGVLTPMPCVPATAAPWAPGSVAVTISGVPALSQDSTCQCMWGGTITITFPGQVMVSMTG
jgi:Domain of unknown function (DUF4280)